MTPDDKKALQRREHIRLETSSSILNGTAVRVAYITCPCGQSNPILLTMGPRFTLPSGVNVWHYEIKGDRITITPSIGLHDVYGHTTSCHLQITDEPFEVEP